MPINPETGEEYTLDSNPSVDWGRLLTGVGGLATAAQSIFGNDSTGPQGYQGRVPLYTASRQMLDIPTDRRPGSGGVNYFSPIQYSYTGIDPRTAQEFLTGGAGAVTNQTPSTTGVTDINAAVANVLNDPATMRALSVIPGRAADTSGIASLTGGTTGGTTATTGGTTGGGTAYNISAQQRAADANAAAMRNPNVTNAGIASLTGGTAGTGTAGTGTSTATAGTGTATAGTGTATAGAGTAGTGKATRAQVLAAYANNPLAERNPSEEAINYWMNTGLANFDAVVNQARAENPALAAQTSTKATRDQVLAAYANNPLAELRPSEDAIKYWMQTGLDNFDTVVRQARQGNPTLAAQIDKARIDAIAEAKAALEKAAASKYDISQNIGRTALGDNITFNQYGNWGPKTGSLEDQIFRMYGEAANRYTSNQISPDEVYGFAQLVRSGQMKLTDVPAAITAAEKKNAANIAALEKQSQTQQANTVQKYYEKPLTGADLEKAAQNATYTNVSTPYGQGFRSGQIAVTLNDTGEPAGIAYYDKNGQLLTSSAFSPVEFLKYAQQFNINPTDLLGVEKALKANKIGYLPYELYYGGGSDHGFDIRDLLSGGLGTAYDWSKADTTSTNKYSMFYSPFAEQQNAERAKLISSLGLKYNQDKYQGGGINPAYMTQLQGGDTAPRGWVMFAGDKAVWYDTQAEAEAGAKQYGGKVLDMTGNSVTSQNNRNNLVKDSSGKWVLKPPGGAAGGLGSLIRGGSGYAAGGRFLRGPGDGTSDSIPARFSQSGQPARLADGEFVIDARTVSELGNGSSEAGARKLYAMMERVHKARKKAGRGKDSGADKYLPK